MIKITSKRAGFRRCSMPHPKEPVDYPDDRFSEEEIEILMAEPMLIVEVIETGNSKLETRIAEVEKRLEDELVETEKEGLKDVAEESESDEEEIVIAAKSAIALGKVTKDGKPLVEAMEEMLGRDITAAERDEAWEKIATD